MRAGSVARMMIVLIGTILVGTGSVSSSYAQTSQDKKIEEKGEEFSDLTSMAGRYVIGPWVGALQGNICTLGNDEPLVGASLALKAPQGGGVEPLFVDGIHVDPDVLSKEEELKVGQFTFVMHGFDKAYALFNACRKKELPAELPNEPLAESEPEPLGKTGWSIVSLKMVDGFSYAKLALAPDKNPISLGVWLYGKTQILLSLSSYQPINLGPRAEGVMIIDKGAELKVTTLPQENGTLIPLNAEQLSALQKGSSLEIKVGSIDQTYSLANWNKVIEFLNQKK